MTVAPDSIDVEPADAAVSDEAIEAIAALLIDDALRTETDHGSEAPT